jgi:hypothetical protein
MMVEATTETVEGPIRSFVSESGKSELSSKL